jgi:hypothetical protein
MLEIETSRAFPINTEFVAMMPGGNVRVASRLDIRVDANRRRSAHSLSRRFRNEQLKFRRGFHIEQQNARAQSLANIFARFPHSRKNDALSGHSNAPQSVKFSDGNNVETAAKRSEDSQNAKI